MDLMILRSTGWALGAMAFGAADLYAVGGGFDSADLLLMALGAAPVAAFGAFVLGSRHPDAN